MKKILLSFIFLSIINAQPGWSEFVFDGVARQYYLHHYDIYGQFIGMQGNILGDEEGIEIAGYIADQTNSSSALNKNGNEILVCWEDYQFGHDTDILCSSISTSDHSIGELVYVANSNDPEMSPYLFPSETGSYLITWENRVGGLDSDIFYQEINNGVGVHDENGLSVCDVPFDQTNPKIGLYSESSNSYIIYWDDKRSSFGPELTNIYCQSVTLTEKLSATQNILISKFNLSQNFPNPFNPFTMLKYTLPYKSFVTLSVYDILGREITRLVNTTQQAGFKSVQWNGTDSFGKSVSAGVYLYQIQADEFVQTKKMMLLK